MSFLKDLYNGEIRPCEEIPDTDEFKAAQSALSKAAKELDDALTAEQKVLFNAYKERFFECIDHSYAHAPSPPISRSSAERVVSGSSVARGS